MLSCVVVLYVVSMKTEVYLYSNIFIPADVKDDCCAPCSSAPNQQLIQFCVAVLSRLLSDGDSEFNGVFLCAV